MLRAAGGLEQAALFELHNTQAEGAAKHIAASSIVRLRHVASGAIGVGVYAFAMAHIRRQAIPGVRSRSNSLR